MITNLRIAIRYSVLISLMMLLWLCLEFMLGLQDKYAGFLNYSTVLSVCVPFFGIWRALKEKVEIKEGALTFNEAFTTAILVVLFASVLAIPMLYLFTSFVNPDYFQGLIDHYVHHAFALGKNTGEARKEAERYCNLSFLAMQSFLGMLIIGTFIGAFWSWRLSSKKSSS